MAGERLVDRVARQLNELNQSVPPLISEHAAWENRLRLKPSAEELQAGSQAFLDREYGGLNSDPLLRELVVRVFNAGALWFWEDRLRDI